MVLQVSKPSYVWDLWAIQQVSTITHTRTQSQYDKKSKSEKQLEILFLGEKKSDVSIFSSPVGDQWSGTRTFHAFGAFVELGAFGGSGVHRWRGWETTWHMRTTPRSWGPQLLLQHQKEEGKLRDKRKQKPTSWIVPKKVFKSQRCLWGAQSPPLHQRYS